VIVTQHQGPYFSRASADPWAAIGIQFIIFIMISTRAPNRHGIPVARGSRLLKSTAGSMDRSMITVITKQSSGTVGKHRYYSPLVAINPAQVRVGEVHVERLTRCQYPYLRSASAVVPEPPYSAVVPPYSGFMSDILDSGPIA
jgi:hypothetical protein